MIQWIYKKRVEILVQVQTTLIKVKIAHQAVKLVLGTGDGDGN